MDYDDIEAESLRAEARAERRLRHWCPLCRGVTWGSSPCAPEVDERDEGEDE